MSSGFVSAGTIDKPTERDDAWRAAQEELEENRRRKEAAEQQNGGKSLYEVLQANKAAKQEAFEEANRLKNQYRALADDEAEFLDEVLERKRRKEAEIKKDTLEQLDVFKKQREEAERKALEEQNAGVPPTEENQWAVGVGRKRKKEGGLLKGVKLKKATASTDAGDAKKAAEADAADKVVEAEKKSSEEAAPKLAEHAAKSLQKDIGKTEKKVTSATPSTAKPLNPVLLDLGYGSSDEDD